MNKMKMKKATIMLAVALAGGTALAGTQDVQVKKSALHIGFKIIPTGFANYSCEITKTPTFEFGEVSHGDVKFLDSSLEITCDRTGVSMGVEFSSNTSGDKALAGISVKGVLGGSGVSGEYLDFKQGMYGFEAVIYKKDLDKISASIYDNSGGTSLTSVTAKDGSMGYDLSNASYELKRLGFKNTTKVVTIPIHGMLEVNDIVFKEGATKSISIPITLTAQPIQI